VRIGVAVTLTAAGRKRKGDKAERETLELLRDHLGEHLTRNRLEGANDHGDITLPHCAVQVKSYADIARAIREGLEGMRDQKVNANVPWGSVFVRRRGGRYMVVMDAEDWISMYREAVL
jgi:hypothetical protein